MKIFHYYLCRQLKGGGMEIKMKYQAILFDLDGTLLPMDNDVFVDEYFKLAARKMEPYGYTFEEMVKALWKSAKAMVLNDGSRTNCEACWQSFTETFGEQGRELLPVFEAFYQKEFHEAVKVTGENPLARRALELAREKAEKVILATNPMFPPVAVQTRLSWVDLKPGDFNYWTHYENSSFCKPNPAYYLEIMKKLGLDASKCLMIGNDAQEDAEAAQSVGMDTFLVTDCLIDRGQAPDGKKGSFAELIAFLERL